MHTTNYYNSFIQVADDCPTKKGQIPQPRGNSKTIAELQYELITKNPYKFTSDDIFFQVYATKNDLIESEYEKERDVFFSKGRPCFRASPLTKRYGFGVHSDKDGKIAIYGRETKEYESFLNDDSIKKYKAMRSSKK